MSKHTLFKQTDCSEPTFIRDLRDIRREFSAEIKFIKANSKYQMTGAGTITPKHIRYMREALVIREQTKAVNNLAGTVKLDKEGKKPVSLSLRFSVIRKIEMYANRNNMNRSQVVEWLVEEYLTGQGR